MTDQSLHLADAMPVESAQSRRERAYAAGRRREFVAYFALIFAATLPLACLAWALTAARHRRLPPKDPVRTAWSQARIIAPMVFSGA